MDPIRYNSKLSHLNKIKSQLVTLQCPKCFLNSPKQGREIVQELINLIDWQVDEHTCDF